MEFAANNRLPAIYELGFFVRDGGLMSYGPNLRETGKKSAILWLASFAAHGQRLPLEQPTHFEFIVNLKTAKASASLSHRRFFHALMRRTNECAHFRLWHIATFAALQNLVAIGRIADIEPVTPTMVRRSRYRTGQTVPPERWF